MLAQVNEAATLLEEIMALHGIEILFSLINSSVSSVSFAHHNRWCHSHLTLPDSELQTFSIQASLPRQQIQMHTEHLGRQKIATLTVNRNNAKGSKVVKVLQPPSPGTLTPLSHVL